MMQGPLLQKITHVSERKTEEMQDYMKTTQQRLQKFAYSVGMIKTVVDNKRGPEQLAEVKKCYVDTKD